MWTARPSQLIYWYVTRILPTGANGTAGTPKLSCKRPGRISYFIMLLAMMANHKLASGLLLQLESQLKCKRPGRHTVASHLSLTHIWIGGLS
jgi:hypothetical protein